MLDHRGPDFRGTYSHGNVFLGHTRLSILDLTPAGNQPYGDGASRLIFNGEVYNWRDLHTRHLEGRELHSHSDTEVLYHLLLKFGVDCLPMLDGMFAFGFYSASTGKLILARDMLGIKPLYYHVNASQFDFSSEVKNLNYSSDPNPLKDYLTLGRIGEECLPYSNIKELLPGSFIELDCSTGAWSQRPYREVESVANPATYRRLATSDSVEDELDNLLQRSVQMHEQSDAPIGFLCSGGLDSSLISAISAKRHPNMALYHADFEGQGGELGFAREVAEYIGVPLRVTKISREEFWDLFPLATYAHDMPVQHPHALSLSVIARRAHDDGLKVLLSGEGADELFAGYWFYRSYLKSLNFDDRSARLYENLSKRFKKGIGLLWRRLQSDPDPYWFFNNFAQVAKSHAHVGVGDAWSLSEPIAALSLVGHDFGAWARWQQAVEAFEWVEDKAEAGVLSMQLFYLRYHLQPLLHRLDRMLMLHSIEGRVPFLENELIEFALNLGVKQKISNLSGKHIVKNVARRYLPARIVDRSKLGFKVPWTSYFDGFPKILRGGFVAEWTRLSEKQLQSWCNSDPAAFYRLVSIEVWGRIFVHGTPWSSIKIEI